MKRQREKSSAFFFAFLAGMLLYTQVGFIQALKANTAVLKKDRSFSVKEIRSWVNKIREGQTIRLREKSVSNPEFLITQNINLLAYLSKDQCEKVVKELENTLLDDRFQGQVKSEGGQGRPGERNFEVGVVGGFSFWRELTYLILGHCYYERDNLKASAKYLKAIPAYSSFHQIAERMLFWNHFLLENKVNAKALFKDRDTQDLHPEQRLQKAYLAIQEKKLSDAKEYLEGLSFHQPKLEKLLSVARVKLEFELFRSNEKEQTNKENQRFLKDLLPLVDRLEGERITWPYAFLAAEIYWRYASSLRIEDPVKNANLVRTALRKAKYWLDPWVERATRLASAKDEILLSEEAFFLSAALSWEMDRVSESISKLKKLIRAYPRGTYISDSYQLLGDYYFEKGSYKNSLKYYRLLAETNQPEKSTYGVYKAAWSFYNLDKKWAALRHLERLLLFYRESTEKEQESTEHLENEVKKDFYLFVSELLTAEEALKELELFSFNAEELIEAKTSLAEAYRKAGRYDHSVALWVDLLETSRSQAGAEDFGKWLQNLVSDLLSDGKRMRLSEAIERYYPRVFKRLKKTKELDEFIGNIILTVHKEARKTDDPDIWKAVDELYAAFRKTMSNTYPKDDVWYFGAQRFQRIEREWVAMEWYKKAASFHKDKKESDAALTVLGMLKDKVDELSLAEAKDEKDRQSYKRVSQNAKWFIDKFPESRQVSIAEFIFIESLVNHGAGERANRYLVSSAVKKGYTKEKWNQYQFLYKFYVEKERWSKGYELSLNLFKAGFLQESDTKNAKQRKILKQAVQESAFQRAFQLEDNNPLQARKYYYLAIETPADPLITMKSWHNMLVGKAADARKERFFRDWERFLKLAPFEVTASNEGRELAKNIFLTTATRFEKKAKYQQHAKALWLGSTFETRQQKKLTMKVEAFFSYLKMGKVNSVFKRLNNDLKQAVEARKEWSLRFTRHLIDLGSIEKARPWVKVLAKRYPTHPQVGALILDVFWSDLSNNKTASFQGFLMSEKSNLEKNPILEPLWLHLKGVDRERRQQRWSDRIVTAFSSSQNLENQNQRMLANEAKESTISPEKEILRRAEQVQLTMKKTAKLSDFLSKKATESDLLLEAKAFCLKPLLYTSAFNELKKLRAPTVDHPQWSEFLSRLDQSMEELRGQHSGSVKLCQDRRALVAPMPPIRKRYDYFCSGVKCQNKMASTEAYGEFWTLNQSRSKRQNLEKFQQVLRQRMLPAARFLISEQKDDSYREFQSALVRLYFGDSWNAWPLLEAAKKNPELEDEAQNWMGIILKAHQSQSDLDAF
jgi:hypothetical protein